MDMIEPDLRDRILADPETLLDDRDVMNALVAANERAMGTNVVDLRGIAMQRLESRLDRLEDTHRSVIAAAYANLSGANQVHRAVLQLLEASRFEEFLTRLLVDIVPTLQVSSIRLVLETRRQGDASSGEPSIEGMVLVEPDLVAHYATGGRDQPVRPVTLRPAGEGAERVHGPLASSIRSEALLVLDLGEGRLPGMVVLGSEDPHQFRPTQGSDLLAFLAGAVERLLRRWLS